VKRIDACPAVLALEKQCCEGLIGRESECSCCADELVDDTWGRVGGRGNAESVDGSRHCDEQKLSDLPGLQLGQFKQ